MDEIRLGTYKLVDDAILEACKEEKPRTYLGGSSLGTQCGRQLYYDFFTPVPVKDARIWRIFRMGDAVEDLLVSHLRLAGLTVYDKDENGEQYGFEDGLIAGHIDGVISGLPESTKPHLFEAKSAKSSTWKQFAKNGCQVTNIKYYVQCQVYMHYMKLDRALFVVYNKDTSELYFERISYDRSTAEYYINRGRDIICDGILPDRGYNDKKYYMCKFCNHSEKCWATEQEAD